MIGKTVIASILALPLLAACNTIDGLGQDVVAVGGGVSSAANYVEREVFSSNSSTRQATIWQRDPQVSVGRACDPGGELSGGNGLPPCRTSISPAASRRSF